ncbi:MAG: two-component system, cell cycle response regulator [Gaiellaceae bacterium]|nr:two-component system, cell cycle response regulator [Gaiellaceae bacterium]
MEADNRLMSSAATPAAADQQQASPRRRRRAKPPVTRRSAFQLLVGVLIVGAIPIVSTARILQANAARNESAHADSALSDQLQNGLRELGRLGDDASTRANDLARSPVVQRAVIKSDTATLTRLAATSPGVAFYLHKQLVAGHVSAQALKRSVWLTVDGARVARIVSSVPLGQELARRLTSDAPHGRSDRLLLAQRGRVLDGAKLEIKGRTVRLGGISFRGLPALVPDSAGVRLIALRPESAIHANVAPYEQRVRYAAIGSFSLLILVAFLFAGPILRVLGDFRRVASQATTDGLTGLANRRTLDEELALEWRRADRVGESLAFVLLDLDNFKGVNDTHGHPAGDAVLRAVGGILAAGVRQVDLAGRYGGEEFALVLPETDLTGALKLAERLRAALEAAPIELPGGEKLHTTASFGVAVKDTLATPDGLVSAADEALYAAKRAGKNRVVPDPANGSGDGERKPERRRPKKAAAKKPAAPKRKPAARKPKAAEGEI